MSRDTRIAVPLAEAAQRLSVNPRTLNTWILEGRVPAVRLGRKWGVLVPWLNRVARGEAAVDLARSDQPSSPVAPGDPRQRQSVTSTSPAHRKEAPQ